MYALTETWITSFTTSAELLDSVPILEFPVLVFLVQLVLIIKTKLLVEVLLFLFMILVKFSPVLLLFLNHLKYSLSLLNFLNVDLQKLYSIQCLSSSSLIYQGCSFITVSHSLSDSCLIGSYHFS